MPRQSRDTPHRFDLLVLFAGLQRNGLGNDAVHIHTNGLRQLKLTRPFEKRIVMASLSIAAPSQLVFAFLNFVNTRLQGSVV